MKKGYKEIAIKKTERLKDQLLKARSNVALKKLKIDNQYELVKEFDGKLFINDCNAIDLNACIASIDQQVGNVIWINYAPPIDRDLNHLKKLIALKVKAIFCFGDNIEIVFNAFTDELELFLKIDNIEEGIILANMYAKEGDVILFSPGAPNYTLFESIDNWNKEFEDAIDGLTKEKNSE
jgi:UDP-N-acetylmuramoylalanine--D-glutamate ligase